MSKLTPNELAIEFERFVNGASQQKKVEFIEAFFRMHRTNMQSAFGVVLGIVNEMSKTKRVDGRNQASKERAELMIKGFKKEKLIEMENDNWNKVEAKRFLNDHYDISSLPLV